ncbi:MAG: dTDP-4-dehydrorhamnose reductase [Planctomycetota bacterium]
MNILLIGSNGQLGTDIIKIFQSTWNIKGVTQDDIDITDFSGIQRLIKEYKPDVIINTAAYHNVPECEKNPEQSFLVNTIAVRNLAILCRALNIKLIHFSTDYVFDGKKRRPYHEDDIPNPLNVYAVSKLAGEFFVKLIPYYYLIRVASLFGTAGCLGKGGTNFVESILKLAKTDKKLEVTSNIICSPTYTYDAALKIKEMIQNNYPSGIYHLANSGFCTWYEFASEIFNLSNIKIKVEPKEEKEEQAGVRRPLFSPLTSKKLTPLRPWQEALKHYLSNRQKSS